MHRGQWQSCNCHWEQQALAATGTAPDIVRFVIHRMIPLRMFRQQLCNLNRICCSTFAEIVGDTPKRDCVRV